METITRGTTPTIELSVDADLTDYTCYLSLGKAKSEKVTTNNFALTLVEGKSLVAFRLTQEQTLSLSKGKTFMQLRAVKDNDAIATNMIEVEILDVIHEGVVTDID